MGKIVERVFNETIGYVDSQITELFQKFFNGVVLAIEDEMQKKHAMDNATQGVSNECITERLKELTDQYRENANSIQVFSEKEIREEFDKYYKEYLEMNNTFSEIDINSEEVFKRFMIYVNSYVKGFTQKMNFFEKTTIEKLNNANNKLDVIQKEMVRYNDDFRMTSKENTELLRELLKDKDEPVITISEAQDVEINELDYKYTFANNAFGFYDNDFVYYETEDYYVISLSLQNIGRCLIEDIEISDFELNYCKTIYDGDDPRKGYYILHVSKHSEKIANSLNILPVCNQKVHLIIQKDEYKANNDEEDKVDEYITGIESGVPFDFNNLEILFKIKCNGEVKTNTYEATLLISRNGDENDITGKWQINYASMKLIP